MFMLFDFVLILWRLDSRPLNSVGKNRNSSLFFLFLNQQEKERLQKLIDNKSTSKDKQAEFKRRLNILNAFAKKDIV